MMYSDRPAHENEKHNPVILNVLEVDPTLEKGRLREKAKFDAEQVLAHDDSETPHCWMDDLFPHYVNLQGC